MVLRIPVLNLFFKQEVTLNERLSILLQTSNDWVITLNNDAKKKEIRKETEEWKKIVSSLDLTKTILAEIYLAEMPSSTITSTPISRQLPFQNYDDPEYEKLLETRQKTQVALQIEPNASIPQFHEKNAIEEHKPIFLKFIEKLTKTDVLGFTIGGCGRGDERFFDYHIEFWQDPWVFAASPNPRNLNSIGFCFGDWFVDNDEKLIKEHLTETELRKLVGKNSFKTFENDRGGICVIRSNYKEKGMWGWNYWFTPRFEVRKKLRDDGVRLSVGVVELELLHYIANVDMHKLIVPKVISIETYNKLESKLQNCGVLDPNFALAQLSDEEIRSIGFDDPKNRDYAVREVEKWEKNGN